VAKRIFFVWAEPDWRPSDSTNVFALDSDYAIAVLSSSVHTNWAAARSSTLEDRIRYTPSSAFETFPWPSVDTGQAEAIGAAGRALLARRSEICHEAGIGLTELYNQHGEGAWADLGELQSQLDRAVLSAYGWNDVDAHDAATVNQKLLLLNRAIHEGEVEYAGPSASAD
jgi:hypothetical protein